jgi:hypothetical protein
MWKRLPALVVSGLLSLQPAARGDDAHPVNPSIQFNESLIEGLYLDFPVEQPLEVLGIVFEHLRSDVTIYPTENYYYFTFNAAGRSFSGNFRLSPQARAEGRIHFAYFDTSDPTWFRHLYLGPDHGVVVEREEAQRYSVSFAGKIVTFSLHDVPQSPPAQLHLRPGERFVGRGFDESGFFFLLMFEDSTDTFFWVLDEENSATPTFVVLADSLVVEPRTGFVFFQDRIDGRHVLAGIDRRNASANNYFDGPFDQLPDNYIIATPFAEYVAQAYPKTRGMLDRRGEYPGADSRLAVAPYLAMTRWWRSRTI